MSFRNAVTSVITHLQNISNSSVCDDIFGVAPLFTTNLTVRCCTVKRCLSFNWLLVFWLMPVATPVHFALLFCFCITQYTVYSGGGRLLTSTEDIIGRWKEYFEDLNPAITHSL
ncbi:hypothetical protein AMECASPLE_039769, partial [Ameca splendens]